MKRGLLFGMACAIALGLGLWLGNRMTPPEPPEVQGFVLSEPRAFAPFELCDDLNQPFTAADFRDKWSLLYFGFTYCPDICPLTLVVFSELKGMLSESGRANTAFYLVSVDPARDTPERLHDYVRYFDADFRGLTGPVDEIQKLAQAAGVLFIIPDDTTQPDYLVDHSSTVTLLNPDGKVHAVFTSPHTAEQLARDIGKAVAAW